MPWDQFWKTPLPNSAYSPRNICKRLARYYGSEILLVVELLARDFNKYSDINDLKDVEQFLLKTLSEKFERDFIIPANFFQQVNIPERFIFNTVKTRLYYKRKELWTKYYKLKGKREEEIPRNKPKPRLKPIPPNVRIVPSGDPDDPDDPNKGEKVFVDPASEGDLTLYLQMKEALSKLPPIQCFIITCVDICGISIKEICWTIPHYTVDDKRADRNIGLHTLKEYFGS